MPTRQHPLSPPPTVSSPTWSRRGKRINVTYDLPSRVYVAEFYPIRSPNGSSIIVYGHENGLTCLWKGGQRLKSLGIQSHLPKRSPDGMGTSREDVVMFDDHRDDSQALQIPRSIPQNDFYEEDEPDILQPFDKILDVLNIPLNAAVLHLTFCPFPRDFAVQPREKYPIILYEKIVVAVACADCSIHLITFPLVPSGSTPDGEVNLIPAELDVQDVLIDEPSSSSRKIPRGISMTWTATLNPTSSTAHEAGSEDRSANAKLGWSFLLAHHYTARSSALKIFEICVEDGANRFQEDSVKLVQLEHLPNPACSISFNPSVFPSESHCQILLADFLGVVRIYNPLLRGSDGYIAPYRPSGPDIALGSFTGAWLVSLLAPFDAGNNAAKTFVNGENRTSVLDARWAFGGKSVIALLADGQWGIWDVTGIGSGVQNSLLKGDRTSSGQPASVNGITRFAIRGYVGGSQMTQPRKLPKDPGGTTKQPKSTKLAPMTPNTRRAKQETLFTAPTDAGQPSAGHSTGGISLCSVFTEAPSNIIDESMLVWYNSEIFAVPSLLTYWQHGARQASTGNGLQNHGDDGTLFGPAIDQFTGPSTCGERITKISHTVLPSASSSESAQMLRNDVLVCAEHRLIISSPIVAQTASTEALSSLFHPSREQHELQSKHEVSRWLNQKDLGRVELDIGAMDKLLDDMDRGAKKAPRRIDLSANN